MTIGPVCTESHQEGGFSLVEVLVALLVTLVILAPVFGALDIGQDAYELESQVAALNQNTRRGLEAIAADLNLAGYKTPPAMTALWKDGGGITADEITIVYANADVPLSYPDTGSASSTIKNSPTLFLETKRLDPLLTDPTTAYPEGMILFPMETRDCNDNDEVDFYPLEVTQASHCTGVGEPGQGDPGCAGLKIGHHSAGLRDLNTPGGFNDEVLADCAVVGSFRVIQYRINPPPPTRRPVLERRDLGNGGGWIPVSDNIENLQVEYAVGSSDLFVDTPPSPPDPDEASTWITRVRVRITGRTDRTNVKGASRGVFSVGDTYRRLTLSTTA